MDLATLFLGLKSWLPGFRLCGLRQVTVALWPQCLQPVKCGIAAFTSKPCHKDRGVHTFKTYRIVAAHKISSTAGELFFPFYS